MCISDLTQVDTIALKQEFSTGGSKDSLKLYAKCCLYVCVCVFLGGGFMAFIRFSRPY